MNRRSGLSSRQLGALALSAAGLPVFRVCCRVSWPWVLGGGILAAACLSGLTLLAHRRAPCPGPATFLLLPLLPAGAVYAAWEASFSFPETAGGFLLPAMVLVLAIWAASVGPEAAGRCAGLLLWITGALYGTVLIFSLPQIRLERLRPDGDPSGLPRVFLALLTPGAALLLEPEEGGRPPCWPWWASAAAALAASLVCGGILSAPLAAEREAFRTLARGVSVLGVIRRFEALGNGAMLMSAFCLCVLLLSAFRAQIPGKERLKNYFGKSQKKC